MADLNKILPIVIIGILLAICVVGAYVITEPSVTGAGSLGDNIEGYETSEFDPYKPWHPLQQIVWGSNEEGFASVDSDSDGIIDYAEHALTADNLTTTTSFELVETCLGDMEKVADFCIGGTSNSKEIWSDAVWDCAESGSHLCTAVELTSYFKSKLKIKVNLNDHIWIADMASDDDGIARIKTKSLGVGDRLSHDHGIDRRDEGCAILSKDANIDTDLSSFHDVSCVGEYNYICCTRPSYSLQQKESATK